MAKMKVIISDFILHSSIKAQLLKILKHDSHTNIEWSHFRDFIQHINEKTRNVEKLSKLELEEQRLCITELK